jgi:hypothetical protein
MAGCLDTVVSGHSGTYLTDSPSYSYFISRFIRHTKFTTNTLEMSLNGNLDRGHTLIAPISTTAGDMVSNMTIKLFLNKTINTNVYDSFVKSTIEYVDLFIGGQLIDRLTTDYISMYLKLNSSELGDLDILYRDSYNVNSHFSTNIPLYLNLPFYFYKRPNLAIPICAMSKQSLEVHIKMRDPIEFQSTYMPKNYSEDLKISKMSILVDYHHLMDVEREFFMTRPIDYIITQKQYAKKIIKSSNIDKEHSFMCNFKHPVYEFMFFLKHDAWEKLTNKGTIHEELDYAKFKINNQVLFSGDNNDLSHDQYLKRYKSSANIVEEELIWHEDYYNETFIDSNDILSLEAVRDLPGGPNSTNSLEWFKTFKVKNGLFYVYSVGMNLTDFEHSGHINMSRIIHQNFEFKFKKPDENSIYSVWNELYDTTFSLYALNYNILTFKDGLCGLKY